MQSIVKCAQAGVATQAIPLDTLSNRYSFNSSPRLSDKRQSPFLLKTMVLPSYHRAMSAHYETLPSTAPYLEVFGIEPPSDAPERHMWPRKTGHCIRVIPTAPTGPTAIAEPCPVDASASDAFVARSRELVAAQWGLVPHWVKSASDGRLRAAKLVNAKSETVSTTRAFHDAWLKGQRCIVPMAAFFEDDWRSGNAVPTRISRIDGKPMGVAGLWASWTGPDDEAILSYTLLTMNANNHALLRRYQQPGSEKRMPVVLSEGAYGAWLTVRMEKAKEFMRQYPAEWLAANPVEATAPRRIALPAPKLKTWRKRASKRPKFHHRLHLLV